MDVLASLFDDRFYKLFDELDVEDKPIIKELPPDNTTGDTACRSMNGNVNVILKDTSA